MIWRLIYRKARMQNRTVQSVLNECLEVLYDLIDDQKIYVVKQKFSGRMKGKVQKNVTFDYLPPEAITELKAYLEM